MQGEPIGSLEALSYYILLATAGHDTTSSTTAGGLLAAVPASHARDIVARLRDAGEGATIIGAVEDGKPFLTVEN